MDLVKRKTRIAGFLYISAMITGIFSVAPSIDSTKYLTEATANSNQVIVASIFQFVMSLTYIGVAILLYPIIKKFGDSLAIGFLSLRIIATTLVIFGTILLLSILAVSQESIRYLSSDYSDLEVLGNVLKATRDYVNHVFMILILCAGNIMFYILLIQSKLIPQWISVWGLISAVLSVIASFLVLFRVVEIITPEYLMLNVPTALLELILGIWLIVKGFDKKVLLTENR
ncbi:MAG: DUF4386 family protein [Planctomycetia bacterium]|nr:DUF4386 family protein [Planctomycetia bacterium]